ncbi:MAG: helix-turn-helix transcriptional regulator [Clostridia bacterium]|nr:helix-turn-helix transcriptional regulator [Clostridia bacterium]
MDVKKRIQDLMDERGWTMYRLAKESNINWSTLRNVFKRNNDPSIYTLECICKGMGMTLPQFFDIDNKMGLTDEQQQLIHNWSKLNEHDRTLIIDLITALNEK